MSNININEILVYRQSILKIKNLEIKPSPDGI